MLGSSYDATRRAWVPPRSARKMEHRSRPNASPSLRVIAWRMSTKCSVPEISSRISMTARRCLRSCSSSWTRAWSRARSSLMGLKFGALDGDASRRLQLGPVRTLVLLLLAAPLAAQSLPPAPAPVAELPGAGRPVNVAATTARREGGGRGGAPGGRDRAGGRVPGPGGRRAPGQPLPPGRRFLLFDGAGNAGGGPGTGARRGRGGARGGGGPPPAP